MIQYEYLCYERPPMPGAVPADGLTKTVFPPDGIDSITIKGVTYNCWGYVFYSRPLSSTELYDYELKFLATHRTMKGDQE